MKFVPGALGALLVCAGLAWVFAPLGLVAAGVFLLLIDRRIG